MDATLEVTLDDEFLAAADAAQRQPSDILADLMREFVERERSGYMDFLRRKVEQGRRCIERGEFEDAAVVEAEFAERRRSLTAGLRDSS